MGTFLCNMCLTKYNVYLEFYMGQCQHVYCEYCARRTPENQRTRCPLRCPICSQENFVLKLTGIKRQVPPNFPRSYYRFNQFIADTLSTFQEQPIATEADREAFVGSLLKHRIAEVGIKHETLCKKNPWLRDYSLGCVINFENLVTRNTNQVDSVKLSNNISASRKNAVVEPIGIIPNGSSKPCFENSVTRDAKQANSMTTPDNNFLRSNVDVGPNEAIPKIKSKRCRFKKFVIEDIGQGNSLTSPDVSPTETTSKVPANPTRFEDSTTNVDQRRPITFPGIEALWRPPHWYLSKDNAYKLF